MNSESRPKPTEQNSRRDFLQKIGAMAAAAPLAANAAAAQPMPQVRFGKHMVSRLIIGCNTLNGASHLSRMIDLEMRAWNTPERLLADFKQALELGINCVEAPRPQLVEKVNELGVGKLLFTARGYARPAESETAKGPWREPKEIAKSGCIAIQHFGGDEVGTDALWRKGQLNKVREYCKMVRDAGVLVAVTSHRPEVFIQIESEDWDVDYYMTCLYKYGRTQAEWEKEFAFNPGMMPAEIYHTKEGNSPNYGGETAFVRGDPPEMYKVIKQTKKPCMVYKLLACGRLCEKPGFVEAAFKECFANIKPIDAVVVGMWTKQEDQYAIDAEYVRRFGQVAT